MKDKNNLRLIALTSVLLILKFFFDDSELDRVIRFIVCAIFLWVGLKIPKNEHSGLKYFFFSLAVLINPFFTLEIASSSFKLVELTVSLVLLGIVFYFFDIKSFMVKNGGKVLNGFLISTAILVVISFVIIRKNELEERKNNEYRLESARKREIQDSLYRIEAEAKHREREEKIERYCNEKTAIESFKRHLDFYYPQYRIVSKIKVKQTEIAFLYCRYELSQTVVDNRYPSITDVVVVEVTIEYMTFDVEEPRFYFKIIKGGLY